MIVHDLFATFAKHLEFGAPKIETYAYFMDVLECWPRKKIYSRIEDCFNIILMHAESNVLEGCIGKKTIDLLEYV